MTAHCLSEDLPFGIVLRDDDGARSVGCLVRIEEVLERFEDGRSNIMGRGTEPFTVLDRMETNEWPEAEIETIGADDPADEGPDAEAARETFASIAERATGERPEPTYLITKPFEPETVTATIWQALLVHRERQPGLAAA